MICRHATFFVQYLAAALMIAIANGACTAEGDGPASALSFDRDVAPVIAARCFACHAGDSPKGRLDLSRKETAYAGGRKGKAITPSNPDQSLLWRRIAGDEMPPKHPLSLSEKRILKKWIAEGAEWGTNPIDVFRYTTDRRAGYDWWALQLLQDVTPPRVEDSNWPRNGIDAFVLRKLTQNRLKPSPIADPRALVRRLHFDLIGLPPNPEVVQAFCRNPTDEEHLRLVNKLLASPHYGERWGRHWLDVARFGESDGFERNNPRKGLWHYRDWVIRSLNQDVPYDQFARLQLIGDLTKTGAEGAAAVGFLVAGAHNTVVGSSERMRRLARQDELEEIVGTVGQTFLGLTVNCARCHDHKFDPIRTTEYYQLIAALDGINHGERTVADGDSSRELVEVTARTNEMVRALEVIDSKARQAILADRKKKARPTQVDLPKALATWDFDKSFKDSVGKLHGKARGGARLANGVLILDGRGAYVETAPLNRNLSEKTLEAWVILDDLNQRGGGVVSVETIGGAVFDAIVFGEREPKRWLAGSDFFRRTKPFQGPEEADAAKPVHVALVYARDGTITGYRNGVPYGKPYNTGHVRFEAGKSHVVFGMRHAPAGGNKMLKGKILRANLYDRALSADAIAASAGVESNFVSEQAIEQILSRENQVLRRRLKSDLALAEGRRRQLQSAAKTKVYTVIARNPGVMKVHVRGSVTDFGPVVPPGGVASVRGVNARFGISNSADDSERRRKLADWITAKSNPLFARVIVNRLWHYHFGRGIVETPNDFGFNGGRPSHPELLDWLALQLHKHDFRLKPLHRLIVTSATYRQSSRSRAEARAKDAENKLLWRYSPRRVEAEVLRDSILQIAGMLNGAQGGPGFEDVMITPNNGTTYYEPVDRPGPEFARRTVYRFSPRGERSAVLDTFDCPDPSSKAPRRSVTTTPLQALSLLNNAFVLRMADRFAERVRNECGSDVAMQVRRAWEIALGRLPDRDEERFAIALVNRHGLAALCRALFNANELIVIE